MIGPRYALPVSGLVLAFAAGAQAQASSPPAGVEPPGFSFVGHWDCEGAMGSGRAHRSAYVGAPSPVPGAIELTETDIEPAGYVGRYILFYDAARKQMAETDVNNGGVSVYRGDGWQDGRLTLTTADGGDFRFVFQVSDADAFQVTWQVRKDAAWHDGDHLTCRKQTAA